MSIVEENKIDLIGTDKDSGNVVITLTDHLDWQDELKHLTLLQSKLNHYIEFIESGQIEREFPAIHLSNKIVIEIVSQYDYPEIGREFLEKARPVLKSIGVEIMQNTFDEE